MSIPFSPLNDGSVMGRIHSCESGGMVDGPGIRYILFLQGCPLRCQYCHNPDTWKGGEGIKTDSSAVIKEVLKYKRFMSAAKGGLTLSGGDPLWQPDFTKDILIKAKARGIHTAVDTSGYALKGRAIDVLQEADLVLLDIKMLDPLGHQKLTGVRNAPIFETAKALDNKEIPVWVRHVIVPGFTDSLESVKALLDWADNFNNIQKIELLPYHNLGEYKWKELGLEYPLKDISTPKGELINQFNQLVKERGYA